MPYSIKIVLPQSTNPLYLLASPLYILVFITSTGLLAHTETIAAVEPAIASHIVFDYMY